MVAAQPESMETVVGIYLAETPDEEETQGICTLFPRVVLATPSQLPDQLGALITSLRVYPKYPGENSLLGIWGSPNSRASLAAGDRICRIF